MASTGTSPPHSKHRKSSSKSHGHTPPPASNIPGLDADHHYSFVDASDEILLWWMHNISKEQKMEILDVALHELTAELRFIGVAYQDALHQANTLLNDSSLCTNLRHQIVKSIHEGGDLDMSQYVSAANICFVRVIEWHTIAGYKRTLIGEKVLLLVAYHMWATSTLYWLLRYTLIVTILLINLIPSVQQWCNQMIVTLFEEVDLLTSRFISHSKASPTSTPDEPTLTPDAPNQHWHYDTASHHLLRATRSEMRMYTVTAAFHTIVYGWWLPAASYKYYLLFTLLPLATCEYEYQTQSTPDPKQSRVIRAINVLLQTISECIAIYVMSYTWANTAFYITYFLPSVASFAVASLFLGVAIVLPVAGTIQLQLSFIDYDHQPLVWWFTYFTSVYAVYYFWSTWIGMTVSVVISLVLVPPAITTYASLTCTAIGSILLSLGVGGVLAVAFKLSILLVATLTMVSFTHGLPALKNMILRRNSKQQD